MKWRRGILVCALIVLGVVIVITVWRQGEPSFKGRGLHAWLKIYATTRDEDDQYEARQALQHIGTNAIPFLLEDVRLKSPGLSDRVAAIVYRWPGPWERWWDRLSVPSRGQLALGGFEILGTNAAVAVPALVEELDKVDREVTPAEALGYIGKPAIPLLMNAATNRTGSIHRRAAAAYTLGIMATNASESLDVLLTAFKDVPDVAVAAVWALSTVVVDPNAILPTLTNALCSSSSEVCASATLSLWHLPGWPPGVVPALKEKLSDPDAAVRECATNALRQIAPNEIGPVADEIITQ